MSSSASSLEFERFHDCGFGLADSGLEKGTGGNDNEVSRARVSCKAVAGFGQRAEDVLGINLVLGTAEEDKTGGAGSLQVAVCSQ